MFTCPDLNFNLVRFRERNGYDRITIMNVSSIPAEWSIKECPECLEVLFDEETVVTCFYVFCNFGEGVRCENKYMFFEGTGLT